MLRGMRCRTAASRASRHFSGVAAVHVERELKTPTVSVYNTSNVAVSQLRQPHPVVSSVLQTLSNTQHVDEGIVRAARGAIADTTCNARDLASLFHAFARMKHFDEELWMAAEERLMSRLFQADPQTLSSLGNHPNISIASCNSPFLYAVYTSSTFGLRERSPQFVGTLVACLKRDLPKFDFGQLGVIGYCLPPLLGPSDECSEILVNIGDLVAARRRKIGAQQASCIACALSMMNIWHKAFWEGVALNIHEAQWKGTRALTGTDCAFFLNAAAKSNIVFKEDFSPLMAQALVNLTHTAEQLWPDYEKVLWRRRSHAPKAVAALCALRAVPFVNVASYLQKAVSDAAHHIKEMAPGDLASLLNSLNAIPSAALREEVPKMGHGITSITEPLIAAVMSAVTEKTIQIYDAKVIAALLRTASIHCNNSTTLSRRSATFLANEAVARCQNLRIGELGVALQAVAQMNVRDDDVEVALTRALGALMSRIPNALHESNARDLTRVLKSLRCHRKLRNVVMQAKGNPEEALTGIAASWRAAVMSVRRVFELKMPQPFLVPLMNELAKWRSWLTALQWPPPELAAFTETDLANAIEHVKQFSVEYRQDLTNPRKPISPTR